MASWQEDPSTAISPLCTSSSRTFDKTPDLLRYISLENHLSDLLGVKVDLVMKSALKPRIGQNILREAVPV